MTNEKNILVFIDWYLPGYKAGGPIQSIANLVGKMPYQFWIVTSLYDHATDTPYDDVEEATWIKRRENEQIMYFGDGGPSGKALKALLTEREYDVIYLNSLFSTTYTLKPLWSAKKLDLTDKLILAPRGMLKSGALSVKSKKKTTFLAGAKTIGLFKGIITPGEPVHRIVGMLKEVGALLLCQSVLVNLLFVFGHDSIPL